MDRQAIAENVRFIAKVYGWVPIESPDMLASFRRKGVRINIWLTGRGWFTVGTALDHPVQGKTQLFRKRVGIELLEQLLANPRLHTDKGFKRKLYTHTKRP